MEIRPIDANALDTLCAGPFVQTYEEVREEIRNAPTLSLNTLRDAIYEDAVAHGLWEDHDKHYAWLEKTFVSIGIDVDERRRDDCATLIHNECDELVHAASNIEAFTEELADVIIMSMSVTGKLGVDIDAAIRRKMEINKGRPWKHGRK